MNIKENIIIMIFIQWDLIGNKKKRDKEKKEICKENGITLIEIPYWWDKQLSSLIATIHQQRKDLISI